MARHEIIDLTTPSPDSSQNAAKDALQKFEPRKKSSRKPDAPGQDSTLEGGHTREYTGSGLNPPTETQQRQNDDHHDLDGLLLADDSSDIKPFHDHRGNCELGANHNVGPRKFEGQCSPLSPRLMQISGKPLALQAPHSGRYAGAICDTSSRVRASEEVNANQTAGRRITAYSTATVKQTAKQPPCEPSTPTEFLNDRKKILAQGPIFSGSRLVILDEGLRDENNDLYNSGGAVHRIPSSSDSDSEFPAAKRRRVSECRREDQLPTVHLLKQNKDRSGKSNDWTAQSAQSAQSALQLNDDLASSLPSINGFPSQLRALKDASGRLPSKPKASNAINQSLLPPKKQQSMHGIPYTVEEDELLARIKGVEDRPWDEVELHFNGRTLGSLKVRYYSKIRSRLKGSPALGSTRSALMRPANRISVQQTEEQSSVLTSVDARTLPVPTRRKAQRNAYLPTADGFVSWKTIHRQAVQENEATNSAESDPVVTDFDCSSQKDRTFPNSLSRVLRQRELGRSGGRAWEASTNRVAEELKNRTIDSYRPHRYFERMSGDVTSIAWSPENTVGHEKLKFAAGSIAITDDLSMQYNSGHNLLVGYHKNAFLQELAEHHVDRPKIEADPRNLNSSHSMRESQDPRLFMTVTAVSFSPSGNRLYTAGSDKKARVYRVGNQSSETEVCYDIEHSASVDLLSVGTETVIATACHQSTDGSVNVYDCSSEDGARVLHSLSPSRRDSPSALPLFPTALSWGSTVGFAQYLLAGFSSESIEEERNFAGEICLWDTNTGQRIELTGVTRNVFDVAWNPSPSAASSIFAVASAHSGVSHRGSVRSVVQCFGSDKGRVKTVLEWDCPALDINDLAYCQHDGNLMAAGATDGKVYLWDKRFADRSQRPLHVLVHGDSVNVLDPERDVELTDTGVRFLAWGATSSRLYTGSSDGTVKVWNPYRSTSNALVQNVHTFETAIMSGAFSPDYRDLLIGEERGRLNLLSVGFEDDDLVLPDPRSFKLCPAKALPTKELPDFTSAREMLSSKQIEFHSMGALPIRQAVQGPNYQGPFVEPSAEDRKLARMEFNRALESQNEIKSMITVSASEGMETKSRLREAKVRVRNAQIKLDEIQKKAEEASVKKFAAAKMQHEFRTAKRKHKKLKALLSYPVERCKLDCNHLPKDTDAQDEVPDSRRSELRIPGALRSLPRPPVDVFSLSCDELYAAGLTGKCQFCSNAASATNRRLKANFKMMCKQRCSNIRSTFAETCKRCSAPIRSAAEGKLCERCNFLCFRCSRPAAFSADASLLQCSTCHLSWEAGVLGYVQLEGNDNSSLGGKHASP